MSDATAPAHGRIPAEDSFRIVQRTITKPAQELDVRPLYVGGPTAADSGVDDSDGVVISRSREDDPGAGAPTPSAFDVDSATGHVTVPRKGQLTFSTYFNAFPASYWRRWTEFSSVRLLATLRGQGHFVVHRSTAKGHSVRVESVAIDSETSHTVSIELSLSPFIDGGWYWFDLEAGDDELVLEDAVWGFETEHVVSGRVTIGITTFNRPDFCVDQLVALGKDRPVLDIIDEIVVVDQGTQKVVDSEEYPDAARALGEKLRIIEQPNLGGSGGFSRAMNEAASMGASEYVLLLDDDVVCQLEGILRQVAFADLAKQPVIVGGQMLSLYDRSVMHAFGEAIAKYVWFWGPAAPTKHGHDFSRKSLPGTPWLHRRVDVDYNGWWMCLIPTQVVREIGLSLPMFIKWDDAEYGLRAAAAGCPTVTLPGAAVWHVPWTEKDDTLDWQAYYHERNRLTSALLHSPYEHGGKLVRASFENHVKRLSAMQYSTGALITMALEDVLDGPERMHRDITHRLGEARELRSQYDDAQAAPTLDAYPTPRRKKPPKRGKGVAVPTTAVGMVSMGLVGLARQLLPERELARHAPEEIVPHVDQRWFRMSHFDSAIVSAADGTSATWVKRDRDEARAQLVRSARLHARLYKEWPELAARYRAALPDLASPETWKLTFDGLVEE